MMGFKGTLYGAESKWAILLKLQEGKFREIQRKKRMGRSDTKLLAYKRW